MTAKKRRGPGRPPGRKFTEEINGRLTPALRQLVDEAVSEAGCSESEWWRRAALFYVASGAPAVVPELADDDP